MAEQLVWGHHATRLVDVTAKWRRLPASDKQVNTLRRLRVPGADVATALTRGQASDLLDAAFAARRLKQAGVIAS
jgi:hypothetical protein